MKEKSNTHASVTDWKYIDCGRGLLCINNSQHIVWIRVRNSAKNKLLTDVDMLRAGENGIDTSGEIVNRS